MDLKFWYLVLKIWSFGPRPRLVSWVSWKCYLEKEASIVQESDSLLWGGDHALFFTQVILDWTAPLAQFIMVHCDLCTMIIGRSAFPSVRDNHEQFVRSCPCLSFAPPSSFFCFPQLLDCPPLVSFLPGDTLSPYWVSVLSKGNSGKSLLFFLLKEIGEVIVVCCVTV